MAKTVVTEVVTLTPELAAIWLETNEMNRKVKDWWVRNLAAEMTNGNWKVNGDTFVFDSDGILVDGQHRCLAVIAADFSYTAIAVRQIAPDARITIDDPMRRSFADDLTMNGMGPNAGVKDNLLRKIVAWERDGGLSGNNKVRVSRADLSRAFPAHAEGIAHAISVARPHDKRSPLTFSASVFLAWLLLQRAPEKTVQKFLSILAIGSQEPEDYVLVRLQRKLEALKTQNVYLTTTRVLSAAMALQVWFAIKGWNAWITGQNEAYQMPRGRRLEDPFPQPVAAIEV